MNCAPRLDMVRRSFSPAWSTEVTSLRSTTHVHTLRLRYAFFQFVLSSLTHGSTKRPCRTHRISAGVLVMVIFSTDLRIARGVPKLGRFSETPNLLIYMWIAEQRELRQIAVPACRCHSAGSFPGRCEVVYIYIKRRFTPHTSCWSTRSVSDWKVKKVRVRKRPYIGGRDGGKRA